MSGRKKKKKKKDRRDYLGLEVDATLFLVDRAALALPQGRLAVDVVGRVYLNGRGRGAHVHLAAGRWITKSRLKQR